MTSISQPSDCMLPLQSPNPVSQTPPLHEPDEQTGVAWFDEQTTPQAPQLVASDAMSGRLVVPAPVVWPLLTFSPFNNFELDVPASYLDAVATRGQVPQEERPIGRGVRDRREARDVGQNS